jgi:hypothetical protein
MLASRMCVAHTIFENAAAAAAAVLNPQSSPLHPNSTANPPLLSPSSRSPFCLLPLPSSACSDPLGTPKTPNPQPSTPNPKPHTPNPKPHTPHPKPHTPNHQSPRPVPLPQTPTHTDSHSWTTPSSAASHLRQVWGLGFGVWGLGFGVWGLGCREFWGME